MPGTDAPMQIGRLKSVDMQPHVMAVAGWISTTECHFAD